MSIPEKAVERYFSELPGAQHAFDKINQLYFRTHSLEDLRALPSQRAAEIAGEYMMTAIAYLANGTEDPYLEELGTTAWHTLMDRKIEFQGASDTHKGLDAIGLPHFKTVVAEDQVAFLMQTYPDGLHVSQRGILIVPLHFVIQAQQDSLGALSQVVSQLSLMRDFANHRAAESQERIGQRLGASQAQFWLNVHREQPGITLNRGVVAELRRYPEGIRSLPERIQYRGKFAPPRRPAS